MLYKTAQQSQAATFSMRRTPAHKAAAPQSATCGKTSREPQAEQIVTTVFVSQTSWNTRLPPTQDNSARY